MSFWDWIRDGAHALYATNDDFLAGYRDLLPGFLQVNGVPLPTDLLLAGAFGSGLNVKTSEDYWTTFGVYLAQTQGGVGAVQSLISAGQAAQAAGTGQDQMPALIIPNVYRVAINATAGSRVVVNVIGVRGTAAGQQAAAAAAVKSGWENGLGGLSGLHTSQYHVNSYVATDLSSASGGQTVLTSTASGGTAGDISTMGACALLKFSGGTRSRTQNGRMFWGPLAESQINSDGRTLDSTLSGQLQTQLNTFMAGLTTAGFPLVVISRIGPSSHTVATASVSPIIATQRNRIR